jgi:hypothetical protein
VTAYFINPGPKSWFGLRCLLSACPGTIDSNSFGVYWVCRDCGRVDYAHDAGWDYLPEDGERKGPVK